MVNRIFSLAVCVSMAVATAAFAAAPGTAYVVQFPDETQPGARFLMYRSDAIPFVPEIDTLGPNNSYALIRKPDGTKFYILGEGPVQRIDGTLSSFQTVNGIAGTVNVAKMTPDGSLLLVGADQFYAVNTTTDAIAATGAGVSGTIVDFAISRDSKRAWVLVTSGFTGSIITVDLTKFERIGNPLNLPFRGRGIFLSPRGQLYVTFSNQIREYNPDTLAQTTNGLIELLATPGPMTFTPDGSAAYFVNLDPFVGGRAIARLDLINNTITDWPPFNPGIQPPLFEKILIAGNGRIFAYSRQNTTLYDVTSSPLGAQKTALDALFPADKVLGVTVSDELPSARFLYALIDNGNQTNLLRVDLSNNTINAQVLAQINSGRFGFVSIPPVAGAAAFLQFNNNQTLQHGGQALPLITRVLDGLGRAIYNQQVTFSTDPANGVVIANPQTTTNADGFVQTGVTVPDVPGVYIINVTAGAGPATTSFTITVPDLGGGTPGGPQLISIVTGDGQLLRQGFGSTFNQPLTVRVTNADGTPRSGVPVNFSVVEGTGNVIQPDVLTNADGLASTAFSPGFISFTSAFETATIRATSAVGAVDFKMTSYRVNNDNLTGEPELSILQPVSFRLAIGQGDTIESGIVAGVHSAQQLCIGCPIPNVGLRISDRFDPTAPGPVACVGSSRSDNLGIARCNVRAACMTGSFGALVHIGENKNFELRFEIGPGTAAGLQIQSGDNQSGRAADVLSPLRVVVTDGCGTPVPNSPLTWTVVQGSATLSQVQTVSDIGGRASATVTLGQVPGPVTVRVSIPNASPVNFTISNLAVVSGIFLQSGGGQSILPNQAFPNPVVFIVRDGSNNPLPGITMNFSVSGNGSINPTQATTNSQGVAQTNVVAGNSTGTITITASFGTFTAAATLQVRPQGPQVTSNSFFNSASFAIGMAPCGLVTVIGNGLAPNLTGVVSGISPFGPLPYTLNGLSISVNGVPAPIQSVANINGQQQATFQAPCELQPGNATVQITISGASTTVGNVPVLAGQPGIFTYLGPNGRPYGAVIRAVDGSYVTPSNLARRGETYFLVLTGLAQVTPATATNAAGIANQNVNLPVIVGVNNSGVPVTSAQYLVGSIGVYIVGFQIPANAATGTDQPLAVAVVVNGQVVFGNSVFLPGVI